MSAYRKTEFQPPCARCGELSTWACRCCNEPRCADDQPEYGPWCEGCEERFGEVVAREGLYMVPRRSRPAFWRWHHDFLHQALPFAAGGLGALSIAFIVAGSVLAGLLMGGAAALLAFPAIHEVADTPQHKLDRRIASARRRFVAQRSRKSLGPADRSR